MQQCRLYDVGSCFEHVENEVLLRKRLDVALSQVPTCVGLLQVCSVLVLSSAELNGICICLCSAERVMRVRRRLSVPHTSTSTYLSLATLQYNPHTSSSHLLIPRFILSLSNNDVTFNSFRPYYTRIKLSLRLFGYLTRPVLASFLSKVMTQDLTKMWKHRIHCARN